jgi:hypothetical protein
VLAAARILCRLSHSIFRGSLTLDTSRQTENLGM